MTTLAPQQPCVPKRRRLHGKQTPPAARPACAKRRRLCGKQTPPPEGLFPSYDVTKARVEHIEAFGGVYGKVWVARDRSGQLCWLKQVKSHSCQDGLPEHGIREVAILKDLAAGGSMPHVMTVADVLAPREAVSQCHRLHIVAEHASHDLVTYARAHELTCGTVRSMAWQMSQAVDFLHAHGVLHRNLKPASVLVCRGARLVVSGFETAIRSPPEGAQPAAHGFILRTHIAVRAPELLLGLGQDHPGMDVWALGCCVAFLALSGSVFQPEDNTDEAACSEIFHRLGRPSKDHPLAALPFFGSYNITWQEPLGLSDAERLLGREGSRLLTSLLDLDYTRRITARAALCHAYFAGESEHGAASSHAGARPVGSPTMPPARRCSGGREASTPGEDRSPSPLVPLEAARCYLKRDVRKERTHGVWCLAALQAVHQRLHRISGLCQHVWGFLLRPRHPSPDYILGLAYIKEWMRAVLIDWLVEVHWKWRLQPAALLLAVDLIDRYLARNPALATNRFQLLGVAALFLAAKVEDEHYDTDMSATTLAWITDRAYTAAEVLDMEAALATSVDFEAPSWGAYHFLCCYTALAPLPTRYFFVAQCYIEQSLCIYRLSRFSPSLMAAGCYFLAAQLSRQQPPASALLLSGPDELLEAAPRSHAEGWPRTLAEEIGRTEAEVQRSAEEVGDLVGNFDGRGSSGKPLIAVRNKFARAVHLRAADLVWPGAESPA